MDQTDNNQQKRERFQSENDNEDSGSQNKRKRTDSQLKIRLLIPSNIAGALIGKGGDTIKRIRTDYDINMTLPPSETSERIVLITANLVSACRALEEIVPFLSKQLERDGMEGNSLRMLIHESLAGRVIGKGGSTITKLKEDIGGHVKIFVPTCPDSNERVILMTGTSDQIVQYVRSIYEIVDQVNIKGEIIQYDARNADEYTAHNYGGFVGQRTPSNRGGRGGMGGGRTRERGGPRDFPPYDRYQNMPSRREGNNYFAEDSVEDYGGGMGPIGMGGEQTTSQVSIPKKLAGAIIGKGGQRIKQVQADSGTRIKMDDGTGESDDRIITIHGTKEQIQYAQYLLQMAIKSNSSNY